MIKVALVDDHKLLRKGLATLIGLQGYEIVIQADNGEHFINQLQPDRLPDVTLLDIKMPVKDGFDTLQWINEHYPSMRVIALSTYDKDYAVIRMLKTGARGYLLKDCEPEEVKRAIDGVLEQGYYHSDLVTGRLIHHFRKGDERGSDDRQAITLTEREREFLVWICSDLTYNEIAKKMFVSPRTVDGYRDDLFAKLDIKSRVGLALYAIKVGLVTVD